MIRIREQFDADRVPTSEASYYRSAIHKFEIPCHICGRPLYVGESTKLEIERGIENDLENPLVCSDCERSAEELEHK